MSERVTAEELREAAEQLRSWNQLNPEEIKHVASVYARAADTISALERERDDALGGIHPDIVHAAAIRWCGQKERETFPEDVEYFKHNWRALPGLRSLVIAERDAALEREAKPVKFRWEELGRETAFYELRVGYIIFGRVFERLNGNGFMIENHVTATSTPFEGTLEDAQASLVAEVLKLRGGE